jgi:hypothetical protein
MAGTVAGLVRIVTGLAPDACRRAGGGSDLLDLALEVAPEVGQPCFALLQMVAAHGREPPVGEG